MASDTAVRRDLARLVALVGGARDHVSRLRDEAGVSGSQGTDPLAAWLYGTWYSSPPEPVALDRAALYRPELSTALRASLPGSKQWSTGWVVLDVGHGGACVAGRRGASRAVRAGEYASLSRPGVPVMPGDAVAIAACLDWVDWPSGFWTTRSAHAEPSPPFVRLYFSVDVGHIAGVLSNVVDGLGALGLRYSLKCPVWPAGYSRVDTLVVYLEHAAWDGARDAVTLMARHLETRLRPWCPPLTLRLAHGVAFAEDPGGNESFGQCRCRMLADAALVLAQQPDLRVDDGVDALMRGLAAAGLDPERPWLNGKG